MMETAMYSFGKMTIVRKNLFKGCDVKVELDIAEQEAIQWAHLRGLKTPFLSYKILEHHDHYSLEIYIKN